MPGTVERAAGDPRRHTPLCVTRGSPVLVPEKMRWGAHTRTLREPGEISLVADEYWCRGASCCARSVPRCYPCIADRCVVFVVVADGN